MGETIQQTRLAVLLFTDIEGSVSIKQKLGPSAYARALTRHDALFRQIIEGIVGARLVTDSGDGFLATFETVTDAINAALRFQFALMRGGESASPLRIRIGIHVGQVTECDESPGSQPKLVFMALAVVTRDDPRAADNDSRSASGKAAVSSSPSLNPVAKPRPTSIPIIVKRRLPIGRNGD